MANMSVNIAGVEFKNPVITASGTFGFGREYNEFYPIGLLGGVCTKGTTLEERPGNPPPRIAEAPAGMLNAIGLQNPGVERFIGEELPWLQEQGTVVIANIAGRTPEEYGEVACRLDDTAVDMIEVNISCPNVKAGGVQFGTTCEGAAAVTRAVKEKTKKPVIIKLSPNVTDIAAIARAVEAAGADAVSLINTLLGMRIDLKTRRPIIRNNTGGVSGPALLPVAVRMVWQVARAVKIPVIGMGGVSSGRDAAELMLAGASAVQVGAACFADPFAPVRIIKELEEYLDENGVKSASELTGAMRAWE